jgi:RNA polymerase sigma factor (sigma-70 family)
MALSGLDSLVCYLRKVTPAGEPGDDGQLLARFTAGDELAFAALVHRYAALVWGVCRRCLPRQADAEDAFQATFLVLVRKAGSLGRGGPLGPWLHQVANRTAVKARVRAARQASRESAVAVQAPAVGDEVPAELRELLDEEVGRLPEKYRQPVVLCYLEGLTNEQAADRLGCPRGTVVSRLSRAREQLRRRLLRRGIDLSASLAAPVAAVPAAVVDAVIRGGPVVRDGVFSSSVLSLAEGVLLGMSLHKLRLAALAVLTLAVLAGAGVWAGRPTASGSVPPSTRSIARAVVKKADDKKPATPEKPVDKKADKKDDKAPAAPRDVDLRDSLRKTIDRFNGYDDPKATLQELLDNLAGQYKVTFDVNEKAFKYEMLNDVLKTEVANPPIPTMKNVTLAFVLNKVLDRIPIPSRAMFLIRKDHIEITTGHAVRRELGLRKRAQKPAEAEEQDSRPALSPLVWEDLKKVPLDKALRDIAEDTGVNVVLDPRAEKKGTTELTTTLRNVPVEAAIEVLADMAGLTVVYRDNILYVTTPENATLLIKSKRWAAEPQRLPLYPVQGGAGM